MIFLLIALLISCNLNARIDVISKLKLPDFNEFRKKQAEAQEKALTPVLDEDKRKNLFLGDVITKWLDEDSDDRKMQLISEFSFIDESSMRWSVPKNWVVDGASIPKVFWALIGSPFVGDYRKASVVHDYYCDVKTAAWQDVHKMFYHASLASGVSLIKSKVMYSAVYVGGPRWEKEVHEIHKVIGPSIRWVTYNTWEPKYDNKKFEDISKWIEENNPSIEEIETRLSDIQTNP